MQLDTVTASEILKSAAQCNAVAGEATRRIVELMQEVRDLRLALTAIAAGEIDAGGNRRNHPDATQIAREALGLNTL